MKKKLIIFIFTLALFLSSFLTISKKIIYADATITVEGSENGIIPGNNYPIEITGLTAKDVQDIINSNNPLYLYTYDKSGKIIGKPIFIQPELDGTVNFIPQYSVPEETTEGQLSFVLSTTPQNQIDNINNSNMTPEEKKSAIETAIAANIYGSTTTELTNPMAQELEKIEEETNPQSGFSLFKNQVTSNNPIVNKDPIKFLPLPNLAVEVNKIVNYAVGIGGGIAFILIVAGAFQIILSAGNPDRVKAGKEMITAALAGLFLIIFSVFILKLIGADILKIPNFN